MNARAHCHAVPRQIGGRLKEELVKEHCREVHAILGQLGGRMKEEL